MKKNDWGKLMRKLWKVPSERKATVIYIVEFYAEGAGRIEVSAFSSKEGAMKYIKKTMEEIKERNPNLTIEHNEQENITYALGKNRLALYWAELKEVELRK